MALGWVNNGRKGNLMIGVISDNDKNSQDFSLFFLNLIFFAHLFLFFSFFCSIFFFTFFLNFFFQSIFFRIFFWFFLLLQYNSKLNRREKKLNYNSNFFLFFFHVSNLLAALLRTSALLVLVALIPNDVIRLGWLSRFTWLPDRRREVCSIL